MTVTATSTSQIQLIVPGEPEFLGLVRLASAGVAHRLELDHETSDDLKLVVTEFCGRVLSLGALQLSIQWEWNEKALTVTVVAQGELESGEPEDTSDDWEELGLLLINSLMDSVTELTSPPGVRAMKYLMPYDE